MTKLNQILALERGAKTNAHRMITDAYHLLQRGPLLTGIARTYRPKDDDGDQLPPESTLVQVRADQVMGEVTKELVKLFDLTATKDWSTPDARGDIVVKGPNDQEVFRLDGVPVTYLLFLEKQLTDLHTFISKLPLLVPSGRWAFDTSADCYASEPAETTRSKKVLRNHVKAVATDKFPAQVDTYPEDVTVGYWRTVKFSGALPASRVKVLRERVATLQQAVKVAREQANGAQATDKRPGQQIMEFVFAP